MTMQRCGIFPSHPLQLCPKIQLLHKDWRSLLIITTPEHYCTTLKEAKDALQLIFQHHWEGKIFTFQLCLLPHNSHVPNAFTGDKSLIFVIEWVLKGWEGCIKISSICEGRRWFEKAAWDFWADFLHPVPPTHACALIQSCQVNKHMWQNALLKDLG